MSTDLLGDPLADVPAMNAPLPWRVYQMNDYPEYFVARSLAEAKVSSAEHWGDWDPELTEDAFELSDASLGSEKINVAAEGEDPVIKSFREYLDELIAGGLSQPGFFASAE